jgi:hypothetical protein
VECDLPVGVLMEDVENNVVRGNSHQYRETWNFHATCWGFAKQRLLLCVQEEWSMAGNGADVSAGEGKALFKGLRENKR